ncbi:putative papain-like cysteine peptidase superfamily [Arabidopsis thaliana]
MEELPIKVEILYESDQLFSELKKIGQYIPLSTFLEIDGLKLEPHGKFEILRVKNKVVKPKVEGETIDVVYTRLRKHRVVPDETKKGDWRPFYDPMKDQGEHDICWAIVTAELVTAIRFCVSGERKFQKNKPHFCYRLSIVKALRYFVRQGIQKALYRPFDGCKEFPLPRVLSNPHLGGYICAAKLIQHCYL